jgi:glycosyltransferase involved in cell wall biosynthesis
MNLLVISAYYHPAEVYGGPVHSMHQRSLALAALGHTLITLTTNANGTEDLPVSSTEPVLIDGLSVLYCPRFWFGMKRKPPYLFFSPSLNRRLKKLKPGDFDMMLVHAAWTDIGRLAWKASRRTGIPIIYYTHGCFEPWALNRQFWKKKLYWSLVESRLVQEAAGVIVCNGAEEQVLRNFGISVPIKRIPWGINLLPNQQHSKLSSEKVLLPYLIERPYILFLSRLHPKKGLDLLIPAFAAVAGDFSDWLLVLAGPDEGGTEARVRRQVAEHHLEDRVVLSGRVSGETKHLLLSKAELFVLPSYSEGFPVAVGEALGYGKPIVITNTCYMPEVAEDGAGLIVPPTKEALEEALRNMMGDRAFRLRCGQKALEVARKHFTWEAVAQESLGFYQEILANQS